MTDLMGVVRAGDLTTDDALIEWRPESVLVALPIVAIFNTGHDNVQITTHDDQKFWLDVDAQVCVLRRVS